MPRFEYKMPRSLTAAFTTSVAKAPSCVALHKARQGKARQGKGRARQDKTRQGKAGQGKAGQ